ncbi:putative methyltransferase NSUN7 isoform X2 [Polypterus senegalus]|uniref:putative methyltransferase NSUN7 isoform X2 n=1 Tax=Polypterus senegalus TaxID=55291 RepID=UPI001965E3FC|nr:putative methyltransferase NSUN7 isoform X2 [Polypterus senegalus]
MDLLSPNVSIASFEEMSISEKADCKEKLSWSDGQSCGYPDCIYFAAAGIFQNIHVEKPLDRKLVSYGTVRKEPMMEIKDETSKHLSFELAFSALKYQDLLEDLLVDSYFYSSQTIPDDLNSLVVVMLYDFQDRKFQPRVCCSDEEIEDVRQVEKYLFSLEDVCCSLEKEGFSKVKSITEFEGLTFCQDLHCEDLLIFPAHLKYDLCGMEVFKDNKLVIQDKSRSLAVHAVKALVNTDDDILIVNAASGLTVTHLSAVLTLGTGKIFACGVKSELDQEQLQNLFMQLECKNIKMLPENFKDIEPTDSRLQKVKIILLLPQCSESGVSNPVEFILNEKGDPGLLQDLSQGSISEDKMNVLVESQTQDLTHALKFPKVQAVVYSTCSIYPEENEELVMKILQDQPEGNKLQPYRISPPSLPLSCASDLNSPRNLFFKMDPSEIANACFVAVLTRAEDLTFTAPKHILARAMAKGILDGISPPKSPKKDRRKSKSTVRLNFSSSGTQAKIAEFINQECKDGTISRVNNNTSGNNFHRAQLNSNMASSSRRLPGPSFTSPRRSFNNGASIIQPVPVRPRKEDKMRVLKPVELVFPPVTLPCCNSLVNKRQTTPRLSYIHWRGTNVNVRTSLARSYSVHVAKSKETLRPPLVYHPRPWC